MNRLPDEILLQILSYLAPSELVRFQCVSRRLLNISRDNILWKQLCFEHSTVERRRRRRGIYAELDERLADIVREAGEYLSSLQDSTVLSDASENVPKSESMKATLLANWDPTYPRERVNFYQEFIHRHAPHTLSWFQDACHGHEDDGLHHEATGAGILFDDSGMADKLIAPLEDGSISIWEASATQERQGSIIARSDVGLLADRGPDLDFDTRVRQSRAIMTETGAVECVSIDTRLKKGFFAVQNVLNEVDLNTLKVISRTPYPFSITALSEARHPTPLTVGTNWTIHIHDTRKPPSLFPVSRTELIAGDPNSFSRLETGDFGGHVSLAQPGALSILHIPPTQNWDTNGDIWVAGRFTSMLNLDRRCFPRLRGTVHSGARLSCLTAVPYPLIQGDLGASGPYASPSLLNDVKSIPGYTMVAAGEYKGKGSLELYSLSSDPSRSINPSDSRTTGNPLACYQNRQTASSSKLLSVAPHGSRLVFSDGGGSLKWVERDGSTLVRHFNINDETRTLASVVDTVPWREEPSDIVQKILPTVSRSLGAWAADDVPLGQDNLITWTGDGRLGMVSYGGHGFDANEMNEQAMDAELKELRNKERGYGAGMRRALEHQARELRWMQGYGL